MSAALPACPYVGLQPFTEADRAFFFGREREIRLVSANLFAARLTVVYGESGVGKSSLLMAGVLPHLRQRPRTAVVFYRDWQRPDPLAAIKQAVCEAAQALAGRPLSLAPELPLDELLAAAGHEVHCTTLVILDQFEEYFLYAPPPQAEPAFDVELARAVNRRELDAGFAISIREDSLSRLDRFRARIPTVLANPLRLHHLRPDEAQDAIRKPLQVYNQRLAGGEAAVTIEDGLVDALIDQTSSGRVSLSGRGGATLRSETGDAQARVESPYLQLVLTRLWREEAAAGSHTLRLQTLESLGGAERVVRTHLDQVMATLSAQDQALCAAFFDRMVTPSGSKIACRLDDLQQWAGPARAAEVPRVVAALGSSQARILRVIDPLPGQPPQYEIFHDVLAAGVRDWQARFEASRARDLAQQEAAERERREAETRALAVEREQAGVMARNLRRTRLALGLAVLAMLVAGVATWVALERTADAARKAQLLAESNAAAATQKALAAEIQASAAVSAREAAEQLAEQSDKARIEAQRLTEAARKSEARAKRYAALAAAGEKAAREAQRVAEEQRAEAQAQREEADVQRQRAEDEAQKAAQTLRRFHTVLAQDMFNSLYDARLVLDGMFGMRTRMMVRRFQEDAGLETTADLDTATMSCITRLNRLTDAAERQRALATACRPRAVTPIVIPPRDTQTPGLAPALTEGPTPDEMSARMQLGYTLQSFLNGLYDDARLRVDGLVGDLTKAQIRRFQSDAGLEPTGEPDQATVGCVQRLASLDVAALRARLTGACKLPAAPR